jgi:glycosyltransferase involved in cell wall biosynthesis
MVCVREGEERAIHVGLNAHLLSLAGSYRSAGISSYIYNLLRHLPEADPDINYTVFLSDRRYPEAAPLRLSISRLPTHRPAIRILWEQAIQPWAVYRAGVDLLHGPAFVGPMLSNRSCVITIHDLSFLRFPESFRTPNRVYLRILTRSSVQRAQRVIAVSESTKHDLIRYWDLDPAKVDVVYNGVDTSFQPLPVRQVEAFRARLGLPERFILFVGTLEPRKNVVRLVEAYARLPQTRPPLMLVGGKGWLYDKVFALVEALNLSGEVQFVGYVPAEDLPCWYNAADLFVFPSLYDGGFGLPPLEAMACGTPVITAMTSSLPEVVGQAGTLVDPTDAEAMALAMQRVLTDADLREEMRAAGLERAQLFSWRRTAQDTADTYRRALSVGEGEENV